eukprot:7630922-Ditylum_brightwellii.AAC.1
MRTAPSMKCASNPDVKQARLRTTPADTDSPTYEPAIPFFDEGTPKEWIKFPHGLQAVLKGQNVMQGPASYAVAKTLLKGDALMFFNLSETTHRNQT